MLLKYAIKVYKYDIKVYKYTLNERSLIRSENNGKIYVYAWLNIILILQQVILRDISIVQKAKKKICIASLGRKHTQVVTLNRKSVPISSIEVEVIDLYINITTVYKSIHKAAIAINSDIKSNNFLFSYIPFCG